MGSSPVMCTPCQIELIRLASLAGCFAALPSCLNGINAHPRNPSEKHHFLLCPHCQAGQPPASARKHPRTLGTHSSFPCLSAQLHATPHLPFVSVVCTALCLYSSNSKRKLLRNNMQNRTLESDEIFFFFKPEIDCLKFSPFIARLYAPL